MPRASHRTKILIAVDDSPDSREATDFLKRLAPPEQCEVRMLHVVEPMDRSFYPELGPALPASMADIQRERTRKGRLFLESQLQRMKKAGYRATGTLGRGHIRSTIVDIAEKWKADLILLGSRGRTGLKRMLLGSVSDHVSRHAHCSVLIVRLPQR